jgi:Protein of unknown function (DUF3179)
VQATTPATSQDAARKTRNRGLVLLFTVFVLLTFGIFFFPAYVIQPFKYQNQRVLAWAMAVRQWAPILTLVTSAVALLLAILLWTRVSRWWWRIPVVLGLMVAGLGATMARINYFEWMFHHLTTPGFESAANSKVTPTEMVMAVRFGDDARAYPIYEMAYHHIVNDVVGGVPITVTY